MSGRMSTKRGCWSVDEIRYEGYLVIRQRGKGADREGGETSRKKEEVGRSKMKGCMVVIISHW